MVRVKTQLGVVGYEENVSKVSLFTGPSDFMGVLIACRRPQVAQTKAP